MDMENKRFEGEKKLSEKLLAHEGILNEQDMLEFDALLDKSQSVFPFWMKMFGLSFIVAAGITVGWMSVDSNNKVGNNIENTEKVQLGQKMIEQEDINSNHGLSDINLSSGNKTLSIELDRPSEEGINNVRQVTDTKVLVNQKNTKEVDQKINSERTSSLIGNEEIESSESISKGNNERISKEEYNLQDEDPVFGNSDIESVSISSRLVDIDYLPYLEGILDYERVMVEVPAMTGKPVEILKELPKRISFGIQYNLGRTHAGYHETPWVSVNETIIQGVKSFGYGLFGQINIDRRSFVRASFTYNKMGHRQRINDLRYQTGFTSVVLELYSHELRFGADYGFRIFPNLDRLDINIGAGVGYHNVISEESNNYWTEFNGGTLKDLNELKLSPLSYKVFVSLEVGLFKDIILGVEPYVVYQDRSARYTNSTFIADVGDYDFSSGLNFTVKF